MGPWGQAEGLSEPSLLLERCLEKEGKAVCTAACPRASPLPTHGAGGALCAHGACWKAATLLLGTRHASCSETLLLATGWGGGHGWGLWDTSKLGCSLLTAAVPLPSSQPWHSACSPTRGAVPGSPFLLPQGQAIARKNIPELEWGAVGGGTGCPVPGGVQQTHLLPSPCPSTPAMPPLGGAVGSHGRPRLMVGDANRGAMQGAVAVRMPEVGQPHGRGSLSHPGCQRGRVSLSFATGNGDGPSGCLLPPGRRKGVCPAGRWQAGASRGRGGRGTDRSQDSPSSGGYCCFAHVMFAYFSGSAFIGCCWPGAGASVCRAVSTMLALALSR